MAPPELLAASAVLPWLQPIQFSTVESTEPVFQRGLEPGSLLDAPQFPEQSRCRETSKARALVAPLGSRSSAAHVESMTTRAAVSVPEPLLLLAEPAARLVEPVVWLAEPAALLVEPVAGLEPVEELEPVGELVEPAEVRNV